MTWISFLAQNMNRLQRAHFFSSMSANNVTAPTLAQPLSVQWYPAVFRTLVTLYGSDLGEEFRETGDSRFISMRGPTSAS